MQAQNINIAPGASITLQIPGTGIWFESGTTSTLDYYVTVKPNQGGGELVLKPGQHFQDRSQKVDQWTLTAHDTTATITGRIIIGNGDFGDSNVNGTFQLSSAVQVNNLPANPVPIAAGTGVTIPVSLPGTQPVSIAGNQATVVNNALGAGVPVKPDTGATFPVSITGTVNTSPGPMTYTNSFQSTAVGNTAVAIIPAASNVNGVILQQTLGSGQPSGACAYSFLAKATAPTSTTDGDLLDIMNFAVSPAGNFQNQTAIKVAAGKGIWAICSTTASSNVVIAALTTVL